MPPKQYLPESATLLWSMLDDAGPVVFSAAVFSLFSLKEGRGELLDARQIWPALAKSIGDAPMETGFPKPRGEFLVYGTCHAQEPLQAQKVSATVGELGKSLWVFGARNWERHGTANPEHFTSIPVDYAHAFGGPDFPENPTGMGHHSCSDGALPHVEAPGKLLAARNETHPPAGFNALPASWPQRTRLLGGFGDDWFENRWPFLPEDTRPEYRNIAPPDQRFRQYLKGDESLRIENMHPDRPIIESALPGMRCRLFCKRRGAAEEKAFEELDLVPETLWLLPGLELGVLLFRGAFGSSDDEAGDIECFYGAWEELLEPPAPAERHVRDMVARIEAEKAPPKPLFTPPEPAPPCGADEPPVVAGAPPAAAASVTPPDLGEMKQALAEFEAESKTHLKAQGMSDAQIEAAMADGDAPLEPGQDEELEELAQYLKSTGKDPALLGQMSQLERMALAHEHFAGSVEQMLVEQGLSPQAVADLGGAMQQDDSLVEEIIGQTIQAMQQEGRDTTELEQAMAELDKAWGELDKLGVSVAAAVAPAAQKKAAEKPPEPPAADEQPGQVEAVSGGHMTRGDLEAMLARGEKLQGRDFSRGVFSGEDLSGLDFSNCDLRHANFRGANLERCIMEGAFLDKATLDEVLLSGANLDKVSLHRATMDRATGKEFMMRGAYCAHTRMHYVAFTDSDFGGSHFRHGHFTSAVFDNCAMREAVFYRARFIKAGLFGCDLGSASFEMADMSEAELRGSMLEGASFMRVIAPKLRLQGVRGTGADFTHARLQGSRADAETCLDQALFREADIRNSCWGGASLREACLDMAALGRVDFSKTDLSRALIRRCRMHGANLSKARLQETDLSESDMLQGSLRRANLYKTNLNHCNLYGVDLYKANLVEPKTHGANFKGTLLAGIFS